MKDDLIRRAVGSELHTRLPNSSRSRALFILHPLVRPNTRNANTPLILITSAAFGHAVLILPGVVPMLEKSHTVACRSLSALYSIYQPSRSANIRGTYGGKSSFRMGNLGPIGREPVGPGMNVASCLNVHNQAREHALRGPTDPLI